MTRVIHTGDTHIGYKQYHSPVRRQDFLDAFEQVISDAIADDVDAVVHAGDLFHDRRPELQDLLGTISALRELDDAGIPFFAIVGNHESTRGGQWLDLFERLGLATRLGDEPTVLGDVALYGLDHVPESQRDDLEYDFESYDDTGATHAVLVGHGLFEPFAHATWDTGEVLAESAVDFDAVLLGDNHVAGQTTVSDTWVTYCGSTERASAAETDGRGYNVVTFGDEAGPDGVDVRQRALETRPFAFVDVELADDEGIDRVRERVREHDLEDAVAIVEITGEGEPVTPAAVEEFAGEQGSLIARVTDRREVKTEADIDVTFADPDDAVRERIGEMGLSEAALTVDETVRASKIADAKVREDVKRRVKDRVDDLDAFNRAETTPESAAEEVQDSTEGQDPAQSGESDADTAQTTDSDGTPTEAADSSESTGDGQVSMEDYL